MLLERLSKHCLQCWEVHKVFTPNALDEALGLPSEKAAKVALRTQQIIADESGVTNTVDPLAGSYTIEAMTEELVNGSMGLIEVIGEKGGMLNCIEAVSYTHLTLPTKA